jgi:hypothetical protein
MLRATRACAYVAQSGRLDVNGHGEEIATTAGIGAGRSGAMSAFLSI